MKKVKKNLAKILFSLITLTSIVAIPIYKANAASQPQISRSQVEQRAMSIMDLIWTYSSSKNSNIDSKYASCVTLPKQFEGVTTAQFHGIPYDWGGIDGIDTSSYSAPWTSFFGSKSIK